MLTAAGISVQCDTDRTEGLGQYDARLYKFLNNSCYYLVVVVVTVKERFLPKDHAGEHATQTPHVQAVVIHLQGGGDDKALKQFFVAYLIQPEVRERTGAVPGSLPAVQVL